MLNAKTFQTRAARLARWILLFSLQLLAFSLCLFAGNPAYPLKTAAGSHYLTDQNGVPFLIQGDSPWFLTELLTSGIGGDVDNYLSTRAAQGYNAIILDIAANGSPQDDNGAPANLYGLTPFTGTIAGPYSNLLTWNVNYFTNVDWVINRAGYYGICCFCYPMYDGFGGGSWYNQMAGNPTTSLTAYGQFIGNRYKNFTNIVWIGAGDYTEPGAPASCLWNYIAAGIASQDANHLISAQAQRPAPASAYSAFVTVNSTYPSQWTYVESLANYQHSPVLASFDREPYYETRDLGGGPFTALNCRQFAWWSVLSGDAGQFWGNENQWPFSAGWQTLMTTDTAALTIPYLGKLLNTRSWWSFVPDAGHTVVTSGYGTSGTLDYITAARELSGKTVVAYIPQDGMTPTVAMNQLAGWSATAWWYNPRTGAGTAIGSYATTGTQTFTPPDTNDWTLVIDSILSRNAGAHP